ncbi:MAG TPA: phosphosulfolactate synthase [Bacilli bacterium]
MSPDTPLEWHPMLLDPTGQRLGKPRSSGKTMVIDKGLGIHAFEDMLLAASDHIDLVKIGFGTSPLYPQKLLERKIELAKAYDICILPGGTFLEVAVSQGAIKPYFDMITSLGFDGIEVSDGTIEVERDLRSELIGLGIAHGLRVFTEYGKKSWGSSIEIEALVKTVETDRACGAELITIEGRESGLGVGIFDENGECIEEEIQQVLSRIADKQLIMWETPLKLQQVYLLKTLGPEINLGNIAPEDIMSLECLRRGLRSDTLHLGQAQLLNKR